MAQAVRRPSPPATTAMNSDSARTRVRIFTFENPSVFMTASSLVRSRTACAIVLPTTSSMVNNTAARIAIMMAPMSPTCLAKPSRKPFSLVVFVSADDQGLWHLTLPDELGNPRSHERMLRSLGVRATYPQWAVSETRADQTTEIDRDLFVRLVDERVLARTKDWGWPARDTGAAHMTIYQRIRRELVFAKAMAVLREHILRELNAAFARADLGATLSFENLPSAEDCRIAIEDLERGTKPFGDILPTVRW